MAEGTCHALATKPEQSAPYEPECEQPGQLPEHEPSPVCVVFHRPWPHQYEKPAMGAPRVMIASRVIDGGAAGSIVR